MEKKREKGIIPIGYSLFSFRLNSLLDANDH